MLTQIDYLASWARVKMDRKFGQRGAEMVEYAIVLGCICAVGVMFYRQTKGEYNLNHILDVLWKSILDIVNTNVK